MKVNSSEKPGMRSQCETFPFWWLHVSGSYLCSWSFTTAAGKASLHSADVSVLLWTGKSHHICFLGESVCKALSDAASFPVTLHPAMISSLPPFQTVGLSFVGQATREKMGCGGMNERRRPLLKCSDLWGQSAKDQLDDQQGDYLDGVCSSSEGVI